MGVGCCGCGDVDDVWIRARLRSTSTHSDVAHLHCSTFLHVTMPLLVTRGPGGAVSGGEASAGTGLADGQAKNSHLEFRRNGLTGGETDQFTPGLAG